MSRIHAVNMSNHGWCEHWWSPSDFPIEQYSLSPLAIQGFLEGSHWCHTHLKGMELSFTYFRTEHINNSKIFCMENLSTFPYIFSQSFVLVQTCGFSFVFTMEFFFFLTKLCSSKEPTGTFLGVLKTDIPNTGRQCHSTSTLLNITSLHNMWEHRHTDLTSQNMFISFPILERGVFSPFFSLSLNFHYCIANCSH